MTPYRPCRVGMVCLRCLFREVTGMNRRALAAHLRHVREVVMPQLTPVRYARNAEGQWRPVEDADE